PATGSPRLKCARAVLLRGWPVLHSDHFRLSGFRAARGGPSLYPDNGTAYLQAGSGTTLMFSYNGGSLFGVAAVDLAGYSTVVPDFSVPFIGYRPDGSTVSTNFPGTGINFRTVYFGP